MKLLHRAGGVRTTVMDDRMQRAPAFGFDSAREARAFGRWATANFDRSPLSNPCGKAPPGLEGPHHRRPQHRRSHRGTRRRNLTRRCAVHPGMASGHKISTAPGTQHVVISLGGEKLAESDRPVLLDETGLPTRYYLPPEDVRTDLLRPTDTHTTCPFKGEASYWAAEVAGEVHDDVVWSYASPIPQAAEIAGLMCFYPDRVEMTVDGQPA
jgi:uncharacterized protein (DUF427 family)